MTHQPLITADDLAALLAGRHDAESDHDLVRLDVRWYLPDPERGRAEYLEGHLPGAVFVDLERDLSGRRGPRGEGGRHPLPDPIDLQNALRRAGVGEHSPVVIYDQGSSLAAARLWWLLRDGGQTDVQVLDGGMAAWVEAGGEVTTKVPQPSAGDLVLRPGQLPQVDAEGVQRAIEQGARVVDVRAADRFAGENETIDPVAGHIPGSQSRPATAVATPRGFAARDQILEQLGDLRPGDVLTCGSGITAAQALLAAESAGLRGLGIYPGSWSDWISDPSREVATGN